MKGNEKTALASTGLFPTFGKLNMSHTVLILVNQLIISFLVPLKLVFMEEKEAWGYVYYDTVLDVIFFLDILIKFNTPIYD